MSAPAGAKAWNDRWARPLTRNIVAHGDSISLTSGCNKTYLPRLPALLTGNTRWIRCGANGHSWAYAWPSSGYAYTMMQDAPLRVDPQRISVPNWLIAFAGTNGIILGGHSAATEAADAATYLDARIAAGWDATKIVVCTMLPRTGDNDATRAAYNTALVSAANARGCKLARLDLDATIGPDGADTNLTYFSDGTHPTDAGHAIIATLIAAQIS